MKTHVYIDLSVKDTRRHVYTMKLMLYWTRQRIIFKCMYTVRSFLAGCFFWELLGIELTNRGEISRPQFSQINSPLNTTTTFSSFYEL